MCRSLAAKRIVEVGSSFGVSTIYLAAAARESGSNAPLVIGSEIDPRKVEAARRNLARAGLSGFADIRLGDARQTLQDVAGPIDFVLIDSRTGVSDTSGICTMQLPDMLVACLTLNRQSIEGVASVLDAVRSWRDQWKRRAGIRV